MSADSYARRVHRVMDHVRGHLASDLNLGELAKVAHFSPFHFHRIFKQTTGETVAEFTRRARLERAAYLMKASPQRHLSSIALDVGFPSLSEFSRAFRRLYGRPPSAWDRKSRLEVVARLNGTQKPSGGGEPVPPIDTRVVEHPACRLAYVRMRTWFVGDALPRGYRKLTRWLEERGVDWRSSQLMGMSWDHYETTPLDQVRYDFGFVVPPQIEAEGEIGIHEFPALRSVDAHSRGALRRIAQVWDYLYEEWLPSSPYEPDDMPAIKRFRRRPDELSWQEWDLDCSIALRPRLP